MRMELLLLKLWGKKRHSYIAALGLGKKRSNCVCMPQAEQLEQKSAKSLAAAGPIPTAGDEAQPGSGSPLISAAPPQKHRFGSSCSASLCLSPEAQPHQSLSWWPPQLPQPQPA